MKGRKWEDRNVNGPQVRNMHVFQKCTKSDHLTCSWWVKAGVNPRTEESRPGLGVGWPIWAHLIVS